MEKSLQAGGEVSLQSPRSGGANRLLEPSQRNVQTPPLLSRFALQHGGAHSWDQLLASAEAAQHRYAGFWGLGCDCFAF